MVTCTVDCSQAITIHPNIPDHIQAALEWACASLVTFEAVRDSLTARTFDVGRVHEQTVQAIQSLRRVIAELRQAQADDPSALSLGFVAGGDSSSRRRGRGKR